MSQKTFIVAVCGASGAVYAVRLVRELVRQPALRVMMMFSNAAVKLFEHELGYDPKVPLEKFLSQQGVIPGTDSRIEVLSQDDMTQGPASGSFVHHGMAVVPCSMKTLSAISGGFADNLITRSADVCLKEKRPLIIVPRETPYSLIHLENMTRAARAGAVIMPPNPSFYTHPQNINDLVDTVVARILDHLGVRADLVSRWGD